MSRGSVDFWITKRGILGIYITNVTDACRIDLCKNYEHI